MLKIKSIHKLESGYLLFTLEDGKQFTITGRGAESLWAGIERVIDEELERINNANI